MIFIIPPFLLAVTLLSPPTVRAGDASSPRYVNPVIRQEDIGPPRADEVMKLQPLTGWGEIRFPSSEQREDEDNVILEGQFERRMDVLALSDRAMLAAYAKLNYTKDSEQFDYNNKIKPAFGARIRYSLHDNAVVETGIQYEWDHRFETDRNLRGFLAFVDWYSGWDLGRLLKENAGGMAYPGFTWGGIRYPGAQDPEEENNVILEGAVEQGIDWYSFGEDHIVNSFVTVRYILDTEGYPWNNHVTYGLGSKLRIAVSDRVTLQPGIRFSWDTRLDRGETEEKLLFFANWSF